LWKFLAGAVAGALVYLPLMAVANQAVNHAGKQYLDFVTCEIDLKEIRGYALNWVGRTVVWALALVSLALFAWGVVQSILIVQSL
jgi:hypothetical protein